MRLRLGVSGGPVPREPAGVTDVLARDLAGLGVTVLTTHFQPTPEAVAGEPSRRVRQVLAEHGMSVVQATGYNPQLTHPDDDVRRDELERLRRAFDAAHDLGAEMIISGCGSRHPSAFTSPNRHPDRYREVTGSRRYSGRLSRNDMNAPWSMNPWRALSSSRVGM